MIKTKGSFFWILMVFFWPFFIIGYLIDEAKKQGLDMNEINASTWLQPLLFFAVNTMTLTFAILYAIDKFF